MKVIAKRFVQMALANGATLKTIANELGMTVAQLKEQLIKKEPFTYEESVVLMAMFGAAEMVRVIDWRGVNVRAAI